MQTHSRCSKCGGRFEAKAWTALLQVSPGAEPIALLWTSRSKELLCFLNLDICRAKSRSCGELHVCLQLELLRPAAALG